MKKKRVVRPYTKEEIKFLEEQGDKLPLPDIAFLLNRTEWGVRSKLRSLQDPDTEKYRLMKSKEKRRAQDKERLGGRKYNYWSVEQHAIILFSPMKTANLAIRMKRTLESINSMRRRLRKDTNAYNKAKKRWKEIRDEQYTKYLTRSNSRRKSKQTSRKQKNNAVRQVPGASDTSSSS